MGTNVYTDKAPPSGDTPSPATSASSKFNESWPESERASTIGYVWACHSLKIGVFCFFLGNGVAMVAQSMLRRRGVSGSFSVKFLKLVNLALNLGCPKQF
jgi:hypothetical protein